MPRYLVSYINRKNEIFSQSCYAKNHDNLIQKLKIDGLQILAITKLDKSIKEKKL